MADGRLINGHLMLRCARSDSDKPRGSGCRVLNLERSERPGYHSQVDRERAQERR
jgi:hypothetical protein